MSTANQPTKNHISYLLARDELASSGGSTATAQRTVFVYAPNATGSQPANVYTSWTTLLSDVALTRGPITIQLDPSPLNSLSIPGGNLSGHKDVFLLGANSPASALPAVTVTQPFTNGYPNHIRNMSLIYDNGAAAMITVPTIAAGGVPIFVVDGRTDVESLGAQPVWHVDGTTGPCTAFIHLKENAQMGGGVGTNCAVTSGAIAQLLIEMYDNTIVQGSVLTQNVGGSQITPRIHSPGAAYASSQNSGTILGTYLLPAFADHDYARTDNTDLVLPNIAQQVFAFPAEPARDIIIARVVPRNSGRYRLSGSINFFDNLGAPNVITVQMRSRQFATTTVPGNATQVGFGVPGNSICFVAAASGEITYAPASTGTNLYRQIIVNQPTNIPYQFSWSGIVDNQGAGFPIGVETVFAISITPAFATTISGPAGLGTTIPGTITAVELDRGP